MGLLWDLLRDLMIQQQTRCYKVIITGWSIHKNEFQGYDIYIEEFVTGPEGCCKRLVETRKFDLADLIRNFEIRSEPFGLRFKRWLSAISFEFELCNQTFNVTGIDKEKPIFSRIR